MSSSIRPRVEPPHLSGGMERRYVGVLTTTEASARLKHRTQFFLYHMWNRSAPNPDYCPLAIAYRSSSGEVFHWPVRSGGHFEKDTGGKLRFVIDCYYVERNGPSFKNLMDLVECYENNQYLHNGEVDVFRHSALECG